jgi:hypothetical protein
MANLDRRTFLKGLIATVAISTLVTSAMAEELAKAKALPIKKTVLATARVECGPGIIYMDGVAVQTGDCILVEYSSDPANKGVYKVVAVHNDHEVTLAMVHENREVRMHRDELEPFINRDIQEHRQSVGMNQVLYYPENMQKALSHRGVNASRPQKTWPQPRRRRGRS